MSIPTSAHWQPAASDTGFAVGLADIAQSFSNILTTPVGADPLRPEFGSRLYEYIDWPINTARPHLVREVVEPCRRWEPRATITRVPITVDAEGQVVIGIYFKLADGLEQYIEVRP